MKNKTEKVGWTSKQQAKKLVDAGLMDEKKCNSMNAIDSKKFLEEYFGSEL